MSDSDRGSQSGNKALKHESFLRLPQVMQRTGLCRSAIYALETFPKSIKLAGRAVAWIESEVETWMSEVVSANRH
jgi:prophage regulatory protein